MTHLPPDFKDFLKLLKAKGLAVIDCLTDTITVIMADSERQERLRERLQLALDLYETGEDMMRQTIRRLHPGADPATIERMLVAWLRTRPGAEHGDAIGRPASWPRAKG